MAAIDPDVIVIGAGHNGLVCAYYLARAGLKVHVLERRPVVGGAAVTEEFHPGFRNSVASYTVSLLDPAVIADMRLADYGYRVVERPIANFLPVSGREYLKVGGGLARTQAEVAKYSARDAERLPAYYSALEEVATLLREVAQRTPPKMNGEWRDLLGMLLAAPRLLRGDLELKRNVLDLFTRSARAVLDSWFESDPIKAVFGFDAVVGTFASPDTPGSAYVLLHHVFGEVNGKRGTWGHAVGGMGAITQAMRQACERNGVVISTGCPVEHVLTDQDRAVGVRLADGHEVYARTVASNLNPKLLFGRLIDRSAVGAEFMRRIDLYQCGSGTFRMNVALAELPDFSCLPGTTAAEHHQSGILISPTLDYMDAAFRDARAHGWSREPIVEMLIPSTVDDSLAPRGAHVASLFCQQFSPTLPQGTSWDEVRETVADQIIATVDRWAPNFKSSVIGRQILSPLDLERTFGLTAGDIFHGQLSLAQLWSARPVLGYGDYRTPIAGLYMCGAGTHPGGGVSGLPGRNAAREILKDRE